MCKVIVLFFLAAAVNAAMLTNLGLVAIGRIPADALDATGQDTLGGVFSSMAVGDWSCSNNTCAGTLYGLADRGFGDGAFDYRPRIEVFRCTIDLGSRHVTLTNTAAIFLSQSNGASFSGAIAPPDGRQRLDPEGLVRLTNGDFFICEEYGPEVMRFDSAGRWQQTLPVPEIYRQRRENRGFEGLTMNGSRLFALLQSPLMSDSGADNRSINTRLLVFEAEAPVAEYVYQLSLAGKHAPASEILALNDHQFLVLEREGNYKRINLADISDATNILRTPYHEHLPKQTLPAAVKPIRKTDFIDLLAAGIPPKEMPEKWEGLALAPVGGLEALLFVGADNDFKAHTVIHNGQTVGSSEETVDTWVLVYRLRLP